MCIQAPLFLNGVCRHEHIILNFEHLADFLNGVCRHEPDNGGTLRTATFLNGVCRHEHCLELMKHIPDFLNGVCRHEHMRLAAECF